MMVNLKLTVRQTFFFSILCSKVLAYPGPVDFLPPSITSPAFQRLQEAAPSDCSHLGIYARRDFRAVLQQIENHVRQQSPKQMEKLEKTLSATFFVDWEFYFPQIFYSTSAGGKLVGSKIERLFGKRYFDAFEAARKFADNYSGKFDVNFIESLLAEYNRQLKRTEVVGLRDFNEVYSGVINEDYAITANQTRALVNNPYLSMHLTGSKGNRFIGEIVFPSLKNVTPTMIERVGKVDAALARKLKSGRARPADRDRLLRVLMEERINYYNRKNLLLGKLDNPFKIAEYTENVALLYRDLISIHPFADYNGRILRLACLYHLFKKVGLPPSRVVNVDGDLLLPSTDWVIEVQRGIVNTSLLYQDIESRLRMGLGLNHSPYFAAAALPRIPMHQLGESKSEHVNLMQFLVFARLSYLTQGKVFENLHHAPQDQLLKLLKRYRNFRKKHFVKEFGHLQFVEPDFIDHFGKPTYSNPLRWRAKQRLWYRDQIVWRGMGMDKESGGRVLTLAGIKKLFKSPSDWLASVKIGISEYEYTPAALIAEAKANFAYYNKDLFLKRVESKYTTHTEGTSEAYWRSHFISAAKTYSEAFLFAKGESTLDIESADFHYGVQIGFRPTKHSGRSGLLEKLFPKYSEHENEVLEIGVVDPDAVMMIQLLNSKRQLTKTFLRNPQIPNQIIEVKGQIIKDEVAPKYEVLFNQADKSPSKTVHILK